MLSKHRENSWIGFHKHFCKRKLILMFTYYILLHFNKNKCSSIKKLCKNLKNIKIGFSKVNSNKIKV